MPVGDSGYVDAPADRAPGSEHGGGLRPWLLPVGLALAAGLVIVALLIARDPSGRIAPTAPGTAGDTADALDARIVWGDGIKRIVRSPSEQLAAPLGQSWHLLERSPARIAVTPIGPRGPYVQFSLVAAARQRSARLELVTSHDEHAIANVDRDRPSVVNFGPLRVTNGGAMALALHSIDRWTAAAGPDVMVSVIEGRYLRSGEAVHRMTPLEQAGPGQLRGLTVPFGQPAAFRLTPGVRCPCVLRVEAGTSQGTAMLSATIGPVTRSATIGAIHTFLELGPFPDASRRVTLRAGMRGRKGAVTLGTIRLRPAATP